MTEATPTERTALSARRKGLYGAVLLVFVALLVEGFARIIEELTPERPPLPGLAEMTQGEQPPPHVWVAPDVWIRNPASTAYAPHGIRDHKREIPWDDCAHHSKGAALDVGAAALSCLQRLRR